MPQASTQASHGKPAGGVLPVSMATTQNSGSMTTTNSKSSTAQSRLKVVLRRLAPGLTHAEFEAAIGEEWRPGSGKVDWILFRPGKVSKDLAKPSRPSRAYLEVTSSSHLDALAEKTRQTSFIDARNTSNDTVLLGPPTLEFAPYGRVPSAKKRNDPRQGLVDQDPEFIAFLESLTNPIVKPTSTDTVVDPADQKDMKFTVTPLIQHLREKKAAKEAAKEKSTAAKAAKHARQASKGDTTEVKAEGAEKSHGPKETPKSPEKKHARAVKSERVPKVASRPAKAENSPSQQKVQPVAASTTTPAIPANTTVTVASSKPVLDTSKVTSTTVSKKSDLTNPGAAAARMLQRDLGLRARGGSTRRGGRQANDPVHPPTAAIQSTEAQGASQAQPTQHSKATNPPATHATPVVNASTNPTEKSASSKPAPAIMKRGAPAKNISNATAAPKSNVKSAATSDSASIPSSVTINAITPETSHVATATSTATPQPQNTQTRSNPIPSPTATQAFLKHANPSQGITEALLTAAIEPFGAIIRVEIDKRKGFAYVDFEKPEGLQKAMAASPVKVAQGSVQILERKDRPAAGPSKNITAPGSVTGRGGSPAGAAGVGRGGAPAGRGVSPAAGHTGVPSNFRGNRGGARGRGGQGRGSGTIIATANPPNGGVASPELSPTGTIEPLKVPITTPAAASLTTPISAPSTTGSEQVE